MDDLKDLLGSLGRDRDMIDRLMSFLDRQTDHKLNPAMLMGFLGMFNLLTIMNIVHSNAGTGSQIKEIAPPPEAGGSTQSLVEAISGMLKPQDSGQPDLMGLLGGMASKKKINPNLLVSLLSMMNQGGLGASQQKDQTHGQVEKAAAPEPGIERPSIETKDAGEIKQGGETKYNGETKYDRKKGISERG